MSEVGGDDSLDMMGDSETGGETSDSLETSAAASETEDSLGIAELATSGAEGMTGNSEVSAVHGETDHALVQAHETTESTDLFRAQAQVETVHSTALGRIVQQDGAFISEKDQERIAAGPTSIKAVDGLAPGKTGGYHFDSKNSSIRVASLNETQRERSTIHETYHFASHNKEVYVPMPDKQGYMVYNTVGTRQSSWFHSTRTGENSNYTERGRGLNEGITTMFTNRQLAKISPEKGKVAEQQQIYGHAVDLTASLEKLVGEDTLKGAYYGGNMQELESKVERLAGEKEFGHLRECLDRAVSDNYAERVAATREAQEILARMAERNKPS